MGDQLACHVITLHHACAPQRCHAAVTVVGDVVQSEGVVQDVALNDVGAGLALGKRWWTLLAGMRSGGRFSTPAPMLQAAAAAKKLPSASLVGASLLTR